MMRFESVCISGNMEFAFPTSILVCFLWISNKLVVAITPSGFQMLTMWLNRTIFCREWQEKLLVYSMILITMNYLSYQLYLHNVQSLYTLYKYDIFYGKEEDSNLYGICESTLNKKESNLMKAGYYLSFNALNFYI